METAKILKECFLFQNIENKIFEHCLTFDGYYVKSYSRSDILQSCDTDKQIGIVIEGKAVITSSKDGVIIRKLGNNDVYGVAILYDFTEYSTQIKAITDCTILILEKSFVDKCISYNSKIAFNYIQYLASKIGFLNKKISSYTAKSTENKLMTYILQLPNIDGEVILNTDYSAISKMLGIGRASLYRAFDKLEKDGKIIKKDKKIFIKEV